MRDIKIINSLDKIKSKLYFRYELQKIDKQKLQIIHQEKPIYDETFFNREAHTKLLHKKSMKLKEVNSNNIKESLRTSKKTTSEPEYEVEEILNEGIGKDGKKLYLVKWKNWDSKYNTFEPYNNIKDTIAYDKYLTMKKSRNKE